MTDQSKSATFARRVRELLEQQKITIAELAERAELAPSLVSRLLTETEDARREPRLEHCLALARALELPPRELVTGTGAEPLLGEWVPREELEAESRARSMAQKEAASLRTDLAGVRSEAKALQKAVDQLSQDLTAATRRLADVESTARRDQAILRVAREKAEATLASALSERDRALALAQQNYEAWANARSQMMQAQRELSEAKGYATAGWVAALVGTLGGAIVGAAASEPSPSAVQPRRRKNARG